MAKRSRDEQPALSPEQVARNVEAGTRRMKQLTADERKAMAASGGKARAARLTAAERSAIARRAVESRWAKQRSIQTAEAKPRKRRRRGLGGPGTRTPGAGRPV